MIDANTPLEKIAEMCNTMEDLRNLSMPSTRHGANQLNLVV